MKHFHLDFWWKIFPCYSVFYYFQFFSQYLSIWGTGKNYLSISHVPAVEFLVKSRHACKPLSAFKLKRWNLLAIKPDLFTQDATARQKGCQSAQVQEHDIHWTPRNVSGIPNSFSMGRKMLRLESWNQTEHFQVLEFWPQRLFFHYSFHINPLMDY